MRRLLLVLLLLAAISCSPVETTTQTLRDTVETNVQSESLPVQADGCLSGDCQSQPNEVGGGSPNSPLGGVYGQDENVGGGVPDSNVGGGVPNTEGLTDEEILRSVPQESIEDGYWTGANYDEHAKTAEPFLAPDGTELDWFSVRKSCMGFEYGVYLEQSSDGAYSLVCRTNQ